MDFKKLERMTTEYPWLTKVVATQQGLVRTNGRHHLVFAEAVRKWVAGVKIMQWDTLSPWLRPETVRVRRNRYIVETLPYFTLVWSISVEEPWKPLYQYTKNVNVRHDLEIGSIGVLMEHMMQTCRKERISFARVEGVVKTILTTQIPLQASADHATLHSSFEVYPYPHNVDVACWLSGHVKLHHQLTTQAVTNGPCIQFSL